VCRDPSGVTVVVRTEQPTGICDLYAHRQRCLGSGHRRRLHRCRVCVLDVSGTVAATLYARWRPDTAVCFACRDCTSPFLHAPLTLSRVPAAGRRQAIPGALLWAGLCGSSQWALNSLADWRAEKAAEVAGRRRLWAGMSPQQRAEFQAFAASIPSLGPSSTIEGRPVHDFAIHDAGDPPSAKYSAALRTFAASRGLEQRPQAGAGAGNADSAAQDAVAGSEAAARPWHAWLPIHVGSAGSAEEVRLAKLQQRLQHVEELLGAGRSEPGQPGEQGVAGGALSPPPRVLQ
jgi:hypothetical protein